MFSFYVSVVLQVVRSSSVLKNVVCIKKNWPELLPFFGLWVSKLCEKQDSSAHNFNCDCFFFGYGCYYFSIV